MTRKFIISNAEDRATMLTYLKKFLFDNDLSIENDAPFISIIIEIVKNIYDHSNGGAIKMYSTENGHESLIFESCCTPSKLCSTIPNKLKLTKIDDNWSYIGLYKHKMPG